MVDKDTMIIGFDEMEEDIKQIFENYGEAGKVAYFNQITTSDALREQILERAQNESDYGAFTETLIAETVAGKEIRVRILLLINEDEDGIPYIRYYGCLEETSS